MGSLVACATGGNFVGTGGSSSDGAAGGTGGGGTGGDTTPTTGGGGSTSSGTTTTTTTTTMEVCMETPCKLVEPQCGCPAEQMCAFNGTARECHAPIGDKLVDQECTGLYSCAPGALCTLISSSKSVCSKYCDTDAQCGGGLCALTLNDGSGGMVPGIKLCSDACDPTSAAGCPAGLNLGCQIGQTEAGVTFAVCSGAGAGTQGTTCTDEEDCAPGYGCFNTGTTQCLKWCKPPNGTCPAGASCLSFNPAVYLGGVEYGVCN